MKVHHLNCGSMCPFGGVLMDGKSPGLGASHLVCHCQLVESDAGLVLIDTGFGLRDVTERASRLSPFFLNLLRPRLAEQETAVRQIQRLGFRPGDVRHIVVTHLDFDHAGGIEDFPQATVHVFAHELAAARERSTFVAKRRYRPQQWDEDVQWRTYVPQGERWFGFECVRALEGLPPEILLVPLVGHTYGHCGVAIDTGRGWLLNAGDAYFYRGEVRPGAPRCTPGLAAYQRLMEVDRAQRLHNQERLRALVAAHADEVTVFSAHDPLELQKMNVKSRGLTGVGAAPARNLNSTGRVSA